MGAEIYYSSIAEETETEVTEEKKIRDINLNKLVGPKISYKYRLGQYLIYDCIDKHFACVTDYDFQNCQNKRKEAFDDKDFNLRCAPLKKWENYPECINIQYEKMYQNPGLAFCYNPLHTRKD